MTTSHVFPPAAELLVHRPPVVFLNHLLEWSPHEAKGRFRVSHNPLSLRHGYLDPIVLVEVMSQLAAAAVNFGYCQTEQPYPRTGYMMAIDNFEIHSSRPIAPGTDIELRWELGTKIGPVSVHLLSAFVEGQLYASAKIKGGEDVLPRTIQ